MVTRCDECYEDADDTLEIAKFAVERITRDFDSNKWALQHIAKAQTKVIGNVKPLTSPHHCNSFTPGREEQVHCVQPVPAHVGDLVPGPRDPRVLRHEYILC